MSEEIIQNKVDIIVVGAGPAGVSAAITAARGGKKLCLLSVLLMRVQKHVWRGNLLSRCF